MHAYTWCVSIHFEVSHIYVATTLNLETKNSECIQYEVIIKALSSNTRAVGSNLKVGRLSEGSLYRRFCLAI